MAEYHREDYERPTDEDLFDELKRESPELYDILPDHHQPDSFDYDSL